MAAGDETEARRPSDRVSLRHHQIQPSAPETSEPGYIAPCCTYERTIDLNLVLACWTTSLGVMGKPLGVDQVYDARIFGAGNEGEGEEVVRHPEAEPEIRLGYYRPSERFLSSMVSV